MPGAVPVKTTNTTTRLRLRAVTPRWDERVVTSTSPNTFVVRVPLDAPLPDDESVHAFAGELAARWISAGHADGGFQIKAVLGSCETPTPQRGVLSLLVATVASGDDRADAARLESLLRSEASRARRLP